MQLQHFMGMNESKNRPHILAPVGGLQQLYAAVRCGADAVYFGLQGFNARRNAENFGGDDLRERIEYCHERGVAVNLTVNTLVMDPELEDMRQTVDTACAAGADALIVQDMAVAEYAKNRWPGTALHASTQMAVHNAEGVKLAQSMGFKQIVLARELSLSEIRDIYDKTGADLEVFVHGAHCMSVSGLCYLSSMIGGRSGNRGLCAQPCRLDCELCGRDHALSLKDLSYMDHIAELADAGVKSLKIEGRMKRPEYVAASVTACRQAMEGQRPDMKTLQAVFSRSGFTDGYLTGKRDLSMFGYRTKEDVVAAEDVLEGLARLYEKEPQDIPSDMLLYVQEGEPSQLSVSCPAAGRSGAEGAQDLISVTVLGPQPQTAKTLPITEEYARRSLSKTGGTPYVLRDLTLCAEDGLMLPSSALNELRRNALEELRKERIRAYEEAKGIQAGKSPDGSQPAAQGRKKTAQKASYSRSDASKTAQWAPMPIARFECLEQLFFGCPKTVILPLSELTASADQRRGRSLPEKIENITEYIKSFGAKHIWAEIPPVIWQPHMETVRKQLAKLKELGIYDVVVDNIGAIGLAKELGFTMHGGMMLNIMNSHALRRYLDLGLADACISFETPFSEASGFAKALRAGQAVGLADPLPFGAAVYGYLPLMKFRSCPLRASREKAAAPGDPAAKNGCAGCTGIDLLTDRIGEHFTIICREKQYSEMLNCVPLYVGDRRLPELGYGLLYFTQESPDECRRICELYKEKAAFPFRKTAGLYYRKIN